MHSYLHSSISFLQHYRGEMPMHLALKSFFRTDKKFGARDRRWISTLCFAAFRTNKAYIHLSMEYRILCSFLLIVKNGGGLISQIFERSGWEIPDELFSAPSSKKREWLTARYGIIAEDHFFPFQERLSSIKETNRFIESHLHQPYVWLRIRKERLRDALSILQYAGLSFHRHSLVENAIALLPGVKLDELDIIRKGWAEVQDVSSQQTLNAIQPLAGEKWLDCCAASGGKSLLMMEKQPDINLTVCDVRASILVNLEERFKRNKVKYADKIIADLTRSDAIDKFATSFDGVIADVPCSGSGTWGRTPEQMVYFTEEKLMDYKHKQRLILQHVVKLLNPGGILVYITCSVYRDENEEQVEYMQQHLGLKLVQCGLTEGYMEGADTLFSAVMTR
jgi:16S rRNA (cytosine967-C5)-methyltransferase